MRPKLRYLLVVSLTLIVAAGAVGLWGIHYGWSPIIRNQSYWDLVGDFQRAQIRNEIRRGEEKAGWDFQVQMPDNGVSVLVNAPSHPGVVTVKFGDESDTRGLYEYVDYSSPAEIRTEGNVLYVHWVEILFRAKHWILAYDLAGRREITRRRIDPSDIGWFR